MKKRIVSGILAFALMLGLLTGCTKGKGTSNPESGSSAVGEASVSEDSSDMSTKKVGICLYEDKDLFMSKYCEELVQYLLANGFTSDNIKISDSYNNRYVQINQVKDYLTQGVDVLIINPVDADAARTITDLASEAQVPIVYVNREPDAVEEIRWEDYDLDVTYVGCDARQSGIYQGELLLDAGLDSLDLNGNGSLEYYMIEGDQGNIDARYRTEYSVSVLENAGWSLNCLFDAVGNWNTDNAKQLVARALDEQPGVEVVICNNDAMALGAIDAITEHGLTPGKDVFVIGVDALEEALSKIEDGSMLGTVFNDFVAQSHAAADATMNFIKGVANEHYISCEYVKTTKENAQEILEKIK